MGRSTDRPTTTTARSPGGPLWPWSVRAAVVAVPIGLAAMLVVFAVTRATMDWPGPAQESAVLVVILILAALPLLLVLIGRLVARGGAVEAFGIRLEFAADQAVQREVDVSPRMGLSPGQTLNDSSTVQILDTLRTAVRHEVAVVDLENGTAWWETRLLVLCAGAARQGRPRAVAFVATVARTERVFQGWAEPRELLDDLLAKRPQLRAAHDRATAGARQAELAGPPGTPATFAVPPRLAQIAFQGDRRNPYAADQILATELGGLEDSGQHGVVTKGRLDDLFGDVLRTAATDLEATGAEGRFARAALSTTDRFVAVTHGRQYAGLVLREQVVNDVLRGLLPPDPQQP